MPLIEISMLEGRSAAQKKVLVDGIVRAFGLIGVPEEQLWTKFSESTAENWFVGGDSVADRRKAKETP